jgi:hypothetical protein
MIDFKTKLIGVGTAVSVMGMTLINTALAAPDADLVSGLASTSAIAADNKGTILTFITAIFAVLVVLAVAKGGMNWALAKIAGAFGRKKRK